MSHKFGKRSLLNLDTCHKDIVKIFELSITRSSVDFGISQGGRTFEQQLKYFNEGKSKLDPRIDANLKRAKHVLLTGVRDRSEAADIYIYVPGNKKLAYNVNHLCYVAGVIESSAKELYEQGETNHIIRWGGNWNSNGIIMKDQTFQDLPHFELLVP